MLSPPSHSSLKRLTTLEALQSPGERRSHARHTRQETLFVQVAIKRDGDELRQTLRCQSADLSRGGLRLNLEVALETGTLLELWLKIPEAGHNFYLVGNVRWCDLVKGGTQLGVAVRDAPGTDYKRWRRMNFGLVPFSKPRHVESSNPA